MYKTELQTFPQGGYAQLVVQHYAGLNVRLDTRVESTVSLTQLNNMPGFYHNYPNRNLLTIITFYVHAMDLRSYVPLNKQLYLTVASY